VAPYSFATLRTKSGMACDSSITAANVQPSAAFPVHFARAHIRIVVFELQGARFTTFEACFVRQ